HVTWRAGLTWKPVERLSLYVGAGTSVNPSIENLTQTNVSEALAALDPEKSRTYEIGAKWEGFGGRLLLNAAVFRTDKVNARTDGLPGEPEIVLAGKQRVDGFEIGATGKLTENWSIIASYSYLDTEIRESNDPLELGNHLRNVPDHSGSLWSVYELPGGFEIGGGVRYVGERFTNETNARRIEPYWVADATIAYEFMSGTTLRLNVYNLFDERYIDQVGGGHFVPGPGRSGVATVAFRLYAFRAMLLAIPSLLTADQVAEVRRLIDGGRWIDGKVTAGVQSGLAKHNLQLAADCERGQQAR